MEKQKDGKATRNKRHNAAEPNYVLVDPLTAVRGRAGHTSPTPLGHTTTKTIVTTPAPLFSFSFSASMSSRMILLLGFYCQIYSLIPARSGH